MHIKNNGISQTTYTFYNRMKPSTPGLAPVPTPSLDSTTIKTMTEQQIPDALATYEFNRYNNKNNSVLLDYM